MEIKFTIEDIVKRYEGISQSSKEDLDRIKYRISHDINGSYARLAGVLSLIRSDHVDKTVIESISRYHKSIGYTLEKIEKILSTKSKPLKLEEVYSDANTTTINKARIKKYSKSLHKNAKLVLNKKPLLKSLVTNHSKADDNLKELLEMGDDQINKIISNYNRFFSEEHGSEYSVRTKGGEYLTNASINSYTQSRESKRIGKIKTDLESELISHEDIFGEYIQPLLDNIQDHAWEKLASEYNNDIFSREGTFEKECTIRTRIDKENKKFIIQTIDNGYGIHPAMQDKIFAKGATGRKEKEKHGLGLNILKNTIQKMGGKMYFETEHGMGTTFTIELQYKQEVTDDLGNKEYIV
jgi:signal transduction histidine kinase